MTKLSQQNVDTGLGLERIAMILQEKETIFETDLFTSTLTLLEKFFSVAYPPFSSTHAELTKEQHETTRSFRIITEHLRSTSTLIKDGVLPSNEGRGYVLRRLIRRMYYHMQKMTGMKWQYDKTSLFPFFTDAIRIVFPEMQIDFIVDTLIKECLQFQETIQKGQKILDQAMQQATKTGGVLSGDIVFQAYDTYGIPVELMAEVAQERGLNIDME
ncbi:MAG: alanine--tRNA ligase-related protein [bacterium]